MVDEGSDPGGAVESMVTVPVTGFAVNFSPDPADLSPPLGRLIVDNALLLTDDSVGCAKLELRLPPTAGPWLPAGVPTRLHRPS